MPSGISVLEKIIDPRAGTFSVEHAKYVLALDFSPEQHARADELSEKASLGTLTESERVELDELVEANLLLGILQSKARVSLKNHPSAA